MDKFTEAKRSEIMAKIRSKDTKFERDFMALLKKATRKKFLTNVSVIKGKPDIVFAKEKICVFLDSDFWHGWRYPRWKHILNSFWREKIEDNRGRDKKTTAYLKKAGWTVLRFWEHNIQRDLDKAIKAVADKIK